MNGLKSSLGRSAMAGLTASLVPAAALAQAGDWNGAVDLWTRLGVPLGQIEGSSAFISLIKQGLGKLGLEHGPVRPPLPTAPPELVSEVVEEDIPIGLIMGGGFSIMDYLIWNELPVVLGNLIGGLSLTGLTLYTTHVRTAPKRPNYAAKTI